MANLFAKYLFVLLALSVFSGCSHNATDQMRTRFNSLGIQPEKIDLNRGPRCSDDIPFILVNNQRNLNAPYVFFKNLGHTHFFNQGTFVNMVIMNLEMQLDANNIAAINAGDLSVGRLNDRLVIRNMQVQSGEISRETFKRRKHLIENLKTQLSKGLLTTDTLEKKTIIVSFEEAYASYSDPGPEMVRIKINIPSMNYVRSYTGEARDGDYYRVIAKAAHIANGKFLTDPDIKEFMSCE